MGLMPDKPNPRRHSIAAPDLLTGTRRCTRCLVRKPDTDFRWLWKGTRKASACKACEKVPAQTAAADFFFPRRHHEGAA
jgi:hypothetical protein